MKNSGDEKEMTRKRTMIMVKSGEIASDHYEIQGNILDENHRGLLLETTDMYQKHTPGNHTQVATANTQETTKPFAVVLIKQNGNEATFFEDEHQARIFYEKNTQ